MATHYVVGKSQVSRTRTTGGAAPSATVSGHRVAGRSAISRPCLDGPAMPATVTSAHRIHGHGTWRKPCDEAATCDCQQIVFDNFQREVDPGWGFSTPTNVEWTYTGSPFVTGGRGGFATAEDQVFTEVDVAVSPDPAVLDMFFRFQFGGFSPSGLRSIIAAPGNAARLEIQAGPQDSGTSRLHLTFIGGDSPAPVDVLVPTLDAGPSPLEWHCHLFTNLTTLKVNIWPDGDVEPAGWMAQISTADPTYNPNAEYLYFSIDFDDTAYVWDITQGSCVFDDFTRAEASDWGASTPTGNTYTYPTGIPSGVALSVAAGVGVVAIPDGAATTNIRMPDDYPMWQGADGFVASYDFETSVVPSVSGEFIVVDLFHGPGTDPAMDLSIAISSNPADGIVTLYDGSILDSAVKTDWLANTRYRVKFERRPATQVFRAKIWAVADAEPGAWLVEGTTVTTTPLNSFLQFLLDNFYSGAVTLTFDNIRFDACPAV